MNIVPYRLTNVKVGGKLKEAIGPPVVTDPNCFTATEAQPGGDEKLEIMAERYRNRLPIFHPDDLGSRF